MSETEQSNCRVTECTNTLSTGEFCSNHQPKFTTTVREPTSSMDVMKDAERRLPLCTKPGPDPTSRRRCAMAVLSSGEPGCDNVITRNETGIYCHRCCRLYRETEQEMLHKCPNCPNMCMGRQCRDCHIQMFKSQEHPHKSGQHSQHQQCATDSRCRRRPFPKTGICGWHLDQIVVSLRIGN